VDSDIIHGKGQGLIILLHGAPGVGKTSTAECVAESLRKPLYPITCGDLGVTASVVEQTLTSTFAKAEAWDCVLLLDEADVFLAQRTRADLKRNAIVSGKLITLHSRQLFFSNIP
jgi:SpoVK/Ycf46/Vps4 family AAA+-type ATPase